jgi:predicted GNAT family N-acyltransferase
VGQSRSFIATTIDTVGVFFLSLLYVAYAALNSMHAGNADASQVRLIFVGLGMLLLLNGVWNALQRPSDYNVFQSAQELASRKAELAADRPSKVWYAAISGVMPGLRVVNLCVFGILSPFFGCGLLIGTFFFDLAKTAATAPLAQWYSNIVVGYMSTLTLWKLGHTYLLTLLARQVDDSTPIGTATMIEVQDFQLSVIDVGDRAAMRAARFRYECMTEDMIHSPASVVGITREPAGRHFSRTEIASDRWDQSAIHIVARDNGEIVGAVRVCFAKTKQLPVLAHLSPNSRATLNIENNDVEISRLFVRRRFRRSHVTAALLFASARIVDLLGARSGGRIFADVPLGLPDLLNQFTYEKAGFRRTGVDYFDDRYKASSIVLALRIADQLPEYQRKIERNYRRSAKLRRAISQ